MSVGSNLRYLYRFGSATDAALTPRLKDTIESPGMKPGLSVDIDMPPVGEKAQKLDISLLLNTGLAFLPDDPEKGGRKGHGVLAPVNDAGNVDQQLLQEWAGSRNAQNRHRFTQAILDAIVERDVRRNQ